MGENDTRAGTRAERVYGAVVAALYPRSFRQRYAREMRLAFRQLCGDAYRRGGVAGLAHVWIREVPTLLVGAVCERSTTMARTVAVSGRVGVLKAVTAANAATLAVFGAALFAAPTDLLLAFGFVEPTHVPAPGAPDQAWLVLLPAKLMTQTLGMAFIGFGGLLFAATSRPRTGARAPGTGLPGALAGAHVLLAVAFAVDLVQYPSVAGWVTAAVAVAFAVTYTVIWFAEMPRWAQPPPYEPRRAAAAAGEAAE